MASSRPARPPVLHRRNLTLLAAAALATGLIAAGCGGDDDGGESPSKEQSVPQANAPSKERSAPQANALSREEFVAKANEICKRGNAELDAAHQESFGQGLATPEDHNAFATETIVPIMRGQIDEIRTLGIPEGDEDSVNEFLDETESILDQLERHPASFSSDPFAQVKKDFAAYGLADCGPNVGG